LRGTVRYTGRLDVCDRWRRKFRINLETPRLLLRPLIAGDVDWIASIASDPEVSRFLWEWPDSAEQARRLSETMIQLDLMRYHFGQWAVLDKNSLDAYGWVEIGKLRPWSGPSDEIGISYVLARGAWGKGIATEAAGRLLQYAFEMHQLERVMAVIMHGNKASRRVLEKLGMREFKTVDSLGTKLHYFQIDAPLVAAPGSQAE
jgi:RimJ/RimL family protein N-acetyltransferase